MCVRYGFCFLRDLPLAEFHHLHIVSATNKESNLERKYLDCIASSNVSPVIFKYFLIHVCVCCFLVQDFRRTMQEENIP